MRGKNTIRKEFQGVRLKGGRYVSEISNPIISKRQWLGSYKTPQEAHAKYKIVKDEIEEWKRKRPKQTKQTRKGKQKVAARRSCSKLAVDKDKSSQNLYNKAPHVEIGEPSKKVVPEITKLEQELVGFINGVHVFDGTGSMVGEFCHIDDLKIPDSESGF